MEAVLRLPYSASRRHTMAAEWWQMVGGLAAGAAVIATPVFAWISGKRTAQASERSTQITSSTNLQIAEKNAETSLVATNLTQIFSELNSLRASDQSTRESLGTQAHQLIEQGKLIAQLQEDLRQEKDANQSLRSQMKTEIEYREEEIRRLSTSLSDSHEHKLKLEEQQKQLIEFLQQHIVSEERSIYIGGIEIEMNQAKDDQFTRRIREAINDTIGQS